MEYVKMKLKIQKLILVKKMLKLMIDLVFNCSFNSVIAFLIQILNNNKINKNYILIFSCLLKLYSIILYYIDSFQYLYHKSYEVS